MSNYPTPSVIAHRALNYLIRDHKLSYIGLRHLLESLSDGGRNHWLEGFFKRRQQAKHKPVYFCGASLKGTNENGELQYRDYFSPSPTTMLIEAYLLSTISLQGQFQSSDAVYSYKLAPFSKRYIYEPFFLGFTRKNEGILAALRAHEGSVALITDVKSYYPSIDKKKVLVALDSKLGASDLELRFKQFFRETTEATLQLTIPGATGIPIGPAISHYLGQLALEKVDQAFFERYPGRYFRYVDDIAIVIEAGRVDKVREELRTALSEEGLSLNTDKTECVDRSAWEGRFSDNQDKISSESFDELIDRISYFTIRSPDAFNELLTAFRDSGISLPLGKVQAKVSSNSFRAYAARLTYGVQLLVRQNSRGDKLRLHFLNDTTESLLKAARILRDDYLRHAQSLFAREIPLAGARRRWHLQDFRFVLNRLLYLTSPGDYPKLLSFVPDCPELLELRVAITSLIEQDPTILLGFPGAVSKSVGEIALERGIKMQPSSQIRASAATSSAERGYRDSLTSLLAYGLIDIPHDVEGAYGASDVALFKYSAGIAPLERELEDLSYVDELRCLQIGKNRSDLERILTTRFDGDEEPFLEGLHLGGHYHSG